MIASQHAAGNYSAIFPHLLSPNLLLPQPFKPSCPTGLYGQCYIGGDCPNKDIIIYDTCCTETRLKSLKKIDTVQQH